MDDNEIAALVREKLPRFEPSPYLATRIRALVREEAKKTTADGQPARIYRWPGWSLAGALAACVVCVFAGFNWGERRADMRQFGEELVSDHVRAQMSGHLIDVVSTDRHTVKPWLSQRLDFSPPVVDLSADGYPLIGGRMDRVEGKAAAVLVFQRRKHVVTVYVWPSDAAPPLAKTQLLGYTVETWRQSGLNFAAVSDIAPEDLANFISHFRE
jgi:anti-sigma factor RsiW